MASTQGHPSGSLEPDLSPSKSTTPSKNLRGRSSSGKWVHATTNLTPAWLFVSIPLVILDTGYVLLRPLSMPGGSLHWLFRFPYDLYARTDYIYGWKAFNEKNGFTSAQGSMNVVETLLYIYYLYLVYSQGTQLKATRGGAKPGFLAQRYVAGEPGTMAATVGFVAAVMTFSKTMLYGLNEVFSGWSNVGHNEWINLIFLWIIPNGAWLVASAFMSFGFGSEILQGLSVAAGTVLPEETLLMKAE